MMKTIEALMRKGYKYDKIKSKLEESGITDGTEEIEMSEQELRHEIQTYKEKMRKAEMNGIMNEYDVYQSKVIIAESYLVDRNKVEIGKFTN